MADRSKIEWTDSTWNPIVGCTRVSAGCENCYAIRGTRRLQHLENHNGLLRAARSMSPPTIWYSSGTVPSPKRHLRLSASSSPPTIASPRRTRWKTR